MRAHPAASRLGPSGVLMGHDGSCAPATARLSLPVRRYLNKSISDVFEEFKAGFYSVASGSSLVLFNPNELELLVCGLPHLNFGELERAAAYEGYTPQHATVQSFWRTVHAFSLEEKKRFLSFVTGCNRAPMGCASRPGVPLHCSQCAWRVTIWCFATVSGQLVPALCLVHRAHSLTRRRRSRCRAGVLTLQSPQAGA